MNYDTCRKECEKHKVVEIGTLQRWKGSQMVRTDKCKLRGRSCNGYVCPVTHPVKIEPRHDYHVCDRVGLSEAYRQEMVDEGT